MGYMELDTEHIKDEERLLRLHKLQFKRDLDSQIEFMKLHVESHPIAPAILNSLRKLKAIAPAKSDAIVKEMDTFDETVANRRAGCTGENCNIMGIGLSQCITCGWDETQSLSK